MQPEILISMVVTVGLAVGGWLVAHWLSSRRDMRNKQREIQVQYLREAYRALAAACDSGRFSENLQPIQSALNDIQLFGNAAQVEKVGMFVEGMNDKQSANVDALLEDIRNEIRDDLGLEPISGYRWWIQATESREAD